jgi:hypothetical protein
MLTCQYCKNNFKPKRTNKLKPQKYCSQECSMADKKKTIVHCAQCGEETDNPKFCSRSCSAISSNSGTTHSDTTKRRIGSTVSTRWAELSEDTKKAIIEKRVIANLENAKTLGKRNYKTPKCKCINCHIEISKLNKHKMCRACYFESDAAQKAWGHFSKSYNKGYVYSPYAKKEIYLLSGLEIGYAYWLNENNINWDKPKSIPYVLENKQKRYHPDFLLVDTNEIVEIKGYWWNNDIQKMEAVSTQHPEFDIKVLTKKDLDLIGVKSRGSDTTL